ncbi:MAG: hypothetical protein K2X32_11970 [Phycisphaerales bacterium]|nr:hypothetical protein [Phycisphaerales bacterium]
MQGQYIQLILVAVFVGFSVIQWIVRKLSQQRAIKAAQEMEMRAREEALRTGRDPYTGEPIRAVERRPEPASAFSPVSTPAPTPQATPQPDALAQRREQLRRLREQRASMRPEVSSPQAASGQGSPSAPSQSASSGPVRAELWPGGPTIVINQGAAPVVPQGLPQSNVSRQMERPPDTRRNSPSPQTPAKAAKKARRPSEPTLRAQAEQSAARPQRPTPKPVPAPTPAPEAERPVIRPFAIPQTAAQWRAALVTGEILQPPVTERPPRDF